MGSMGIRQDSARGKSAQAGDRDGKVEKMGTVGLAFGCDSVGKSVPWLFRAVGPQGISPQAKPWFPWL